MIRVLIADDHVVVRKGIARLLNTQPDMLVLAEASDGMEVLRLAAGTGGDVLVLDLTLPGLSGVELLRRVRARAPALPVVVLTMHPEGALSRQCLDAGACAYLCKDRPPADLLAAVRAAAAGARSPEPAAAAPAGAQSEPGTGLTHERLSPREREVFDYLVQGFPVSHIAEVMRLSPSTVSCHLAAVRQKLGAGSVAEVLLYAHRAGLLA